MTRACSTKGYPDLTIVTADRRVIFAELKSVKGDITDPQRAWLIALPDHQAYLWRPDDWDDAVRIIQEGHHMLLRPDTRPRDLIASMPEPTCIACQTP